MGKEKTKKQGKETSYHNEHDFKLKNRTFVLKKKRIIVLENQH